MNTWRSHKSSNCGWDIPKAGQAITIGNTEQLFLDDYVVEQTSNITRKIHPAEKNPEPVLKAEYPWEIDCANVVLHGMAMYDQEERIFKMWYYCDGSVAYATSKDGLNWNKPKLDISN